MSGFQVAWCEDCSRDALLVGRLVDDRIAFACIHCDNEISAHTARAVPDDALSELGYDLPNTGANGDSRGCRDGQCGVRQPEPTPPEVG